MINKLLVAVLMAGALALLSLLPTTPARLWSPSPASADDCAVSPTIGASQPPNGLITGAFNAAGFNGLFPGHQYFGLTALEAGPARGLRQPYVPPTLLKAIGWIEASWRQADGGTPVISPDCGYGMMQITSPGVYPLEAIGMVHASTDPNIYYGAQVPIATSYTHNIAFGAKTLIAKWNYAPEWRPVVGNSDPALLEDWYYAVWSYNGFLSSNHPDNAIPLRGEYSCNLSDGFNHDRTQFPYQELVLGCVKHPPAFGGVELWPPIPVTLPSSVPPFDGYGVGMDIPTPQPAHGDPTSGTLPPPVTIDAPSAIVPAQPFHVGGWAVEYAAPSGTGIDTVHVYAYPSDPSGTPTGEPVFLGVPVLGGWRPDVATVLGNPDFAAAGYGLTVQGLSAGFHLLVVYAHSTLTGSWYGTTRLIQVQWGGLLQVGTPMGETNREQWSFATADFDGDGWGDLIGVKMNGTGCGRTEVHVLSGRSGFQEWSLHACTPLEATQPGQWSFEAGDWNRDGVADLIAIKKNGTGCGRSEVHILSGAANFSQWLLQACTSLHEIPAASGQWAFAAGDFDGEGVPDLAAIRMNGTGCGRTEAHVMSGAASFGEWLLHGCTGLHETTSSGWAFELGDYDGDGRSDLYAISMSDAATASTAVHVLSAASRYEHFVLHTGTTLHMTTLNQWAFNVARFNDNGFPDLVAIKMNGTGTASTEVHVMGW